MRMISLIPLAMLALSSPGWASPYDKLAQVEVIPGWRNANGDHIAGLRITLAPGWKTYWRAPGDAGIPPSFSFSGSENIRAVAPHWPVPEVFNSNGMQTIGYHDGVVFPLTVFTDAPDQPMQISGRIDIGVCEEICIPVSLSFDAALPIDGGRDSAITAALVDRPMTQSEAGIGPVSCSIDPIRDGLRVTTKFDLPPLSTDEVVVVESGDANVWVSEAQTQRYGDQISATVDMVHHSGSAFALDRSRVKISVFGGHQAIEILGCAGR
ncbi:disulfide bond corrector protein DsbC [Yoonia maritima]|uniref:Disulfide bond corrector protein DsbC n=2 Tax=Yoonia maritima TaxID=1435347 RepID=A0A2T0VU16_9RHOB|nr:disulfide bond corrector protein DsbC [Yoonia maritima]